MLIGPITPTQQTVDGASPSTTSMASVSSLTESDVQVWLKKNKLDDLCDEFDSFDGDHLQQLHSEFNEDPKIFEDNMKSQAGFQMSYKTYFKFKVALCKLFKKWFLSRAYYFLQIVMVVIVYMEQIVTVSQYFNTRYSRYEYGLK